MAVLTDPQTLLIDHQADEGRVTIFNAQDLDPDHALIAVVGSAKDVREKLGKFGQVAAFDEEGKQLVEKPAGTITMKPEEIFAKFIEHTGGILHDDDVRVGGRCIGQHAAGTCAKG